LLKKDDSISIFSIYFWICSKAYIFTNIFLKIGTQFEQGLNAWEDASRAILWLDYVYCQRMPLVLC